MEDRFLRLQGRTHALELIMTVAMLDLAKATNEPFNFIQQFVANMRAGVGKVMPDHPAAAEKSEIVGPELENSVDEFLAYLLDNAGQLRGAPGNFG